MLTSKKNFIVEKRWALIAIISGVLLGFGSAIICIAWNLIIFGFNIMYIVSPLIAGFVETTIAHKKYGKSTGAISALLTFFLINGYGWFGPGWIFPKEPVTLSLITIIAIILTIQAAFPILMNYVLFVAAVSIIRKVIAIMIFIPSKIQRKIPVAGGGEEIINGPSPDEIFLDGLTIPLLSVPLVNEGKIKKYVGFVVGEAVVEEKVSESIVSKLSDIIEPIGMEDIKLGEGRKMAMSRMIDEAKSLGADTVIEVLIDYVTMGGLQGNVLIVTATGTAVIFE
jgi:uncharacterized protein YbjQ (UPF0145 family)